MVPDHPGAMVLCEGERDLRLWLLTLGSQRGLHSDKTGVVTPRLLTASTLQGHPSTSDSDIPLTFPKETEECRQLLLCKCSSKRKARFMALEAKIWSSCPR